MSDLQSLETAKAALDKQLITQADFDSVKEGFVAAQKLKAGVDAGLLRPEDYERARDAFLEMMGITGSRPGANKVTKRTPQQTSQTVVPSAPPLNVSRPPPPSPRKATTTPKKTTSPTAKGLAQKPTSMSGISVSDEAVAEYNKMKARSEYLWMTFEINEAGTEVVLADTAGVDATYEDFVDILPEHECKYGVYDFHYEASENRSFNKIVFFNWAPDTAPVKKKMMFASTKDFFKQNLPGIQVEVHCTVYSDLTEDNVREAVKATLTRQ